jgi:hypothetical protein
VTEAREKTEIPVARELIDDILRVYKPHCRYLKRAVVEAGAGGDPFPVVLRGDFGIAESCYIDDTGHLNAVEVNIAFNQAYYVVTAQACASALIPALEGWDLPRFRRWYLEGSLIHDLHSRFKRVIDPRAFQGEVAITSMLRTRRFLVLKLAHRFWDAGGGLASGTVTMALGEGKPPARGGGEA